MGNDFFKKFLKGVFKAQKNFKLSLAIILVFVLAGAGVLLYIRHHYQTGDILDTAEHDVQLSNDVPIATDSAKIQLPPVVKSVKTTGVVSATGKAQVVKRVALAKVQMKKVGKTALRPNYTVKRGDSLWKIAKTHYNNGNQWHQVYNTNHKVIGPNPNHIVVGLRLHLR